MKELKIEHFDAELLATEYANSYPEKDYHDLQHAFIAGIFAYSKPSNKRIKELEIALENVLKSINSEFPQIADQRAIIRKALKNNRI